MEQSVEGSLPLKSKIALILCLILLIAGLIVSIISINNAATPDIYVTIQRGSNYKIVYDRETKVIYNMTDGKYNTGELFPLYNADGSLKLYTGE